MTAASGTRVRYRTVLADREFAALFAAQGLSLLGDQLARIALAVLVYRRTGSAFGASATYGVSYLAYLVGGPLLSGFADRYPRLTVMVGCDLLRAPLVLLLCVQSLPLWVVFVVIVALGALAPPFDSARSSLQPDLLVGESYVVGNALMTLTIQLANVLGFVLGGAVVAATSVRGALAVDAATFLVSAGLLLSAVRHRAAAQDAQSRGTLLHDTLEGLRLVSGTPELRALLLVSVLGSIAVTSTEGLAVPTAADLGGGATTAGILTASVPAGFLLGSALVLRVAPAQRTALLPRLLLVAGVPLLASPWATSTAALVVLWTIAGCGATVNLIAGPAFMERCPREFRGRAFGLAATVLLASQGVGLLAAGVLAVHLNPRTAVAVTSAVMLVAATPLLRAQGSSRTIRKGRQADVSGEGRP
jgi:MFS family permease